MNRKGHGIELKKSYFDQGEKNLMSLIEERKQLAEDLVTGNNFEKHEQNRLDWIAENEKSAKIIQEADEFLKRLKNETGS